MVHSVALLATLAACAAVADAHSSMAVPKPTYPANFYTYMNPVMRIDSTGMETSIPGYQGVQKITAVMKGQSSLKSFIMSKAVLTGTGSATKECGWALADGEKQPLPTAVDFPWAHPGPCEVWCDNTKVLYNDNCMGNNVGKVSLGGKCSGAKMIQAMYIGTHVENWEVYMSCAPIGTGGGSSAAAGGATSGGATAGGASSGGGATTPTGGNANTGSNTSTGANNQNSGGTTSGNSNAGTTNANKTTGNNSNSNSNTANTGGNTNTNKNTVSNNSQSGGNNRNANTNNSTRNTNSGNRNANANGNNNSNRSFDFGAIGQTNSYTGRPGRSLRVV